MAKQFGFGKKEKLKSRKQIDELFEKGKSFTVFPLRVSYSFAPAAAPILQAGVTASKRNFKKAVDRNRIKRLLREAYRLQKMELDLEVKQRSVKGFIFFMYTDKTIAPFITIKEAMALSLKKLLQKLPRHEGTA
jgi:ribonuclease P protein component